jgi:hypothetical protein
MFKKCMIFGFLILAVAGGSAFSANYLFFLEAQGIAGYSTALKKAVFFSMSQLEAMQKPSLGFDYVQRFSGESGDFAVLAVQARLAVNAEGEKTLEPQLYNAYLKIKTRAADIWVGHNRPKFGLASSLDSHAQLLQPLSMNGFGFDRDWGIGLERDYAWGNAGISLTTGSGMPLTFKGNYFLAGRFSRGILNQDNYSVGFSAGYGKVLDVMGYHLMSDEPMEFSMAGLDFTWLRNNLEHRLEFLGGGLNGQGVFALFWRTGLGLLEESRLKLEAQPVIVFARQKTQIQFTVGATYLATADWTLRAMVQVDKDTKDARFVIQAYFYKGIRF